MSRASASDRATLIPRVAFSLINFDQSDWRGRAIPAGGCGNRLSRAPKVVRATGAYCGWMRQSVFARACEGPRSRRPDAQSGAACGLEPAELQAYVSQCHDQLVIRTGHAGLPIRGEHIAEL